MHFESVAVEYAAARPPYPASLWRDVMSTGLVAPGRRTLDLGAGSGQVTKVLLEHGMDVVAVEPGANLAAIIRQELPRAAVIQARAEDIELESESFDLVTAATAVHWMDLRIVLPTVHNSLRHGGRLLVWRNVFGDASAQVTPFRREMQRIIEGRKAPRAGKPDDAQANADAIAQTGLFTVERVIRYRWVVELTTDQVSALFGTFSDWTAAEVEEVASAADRLGGSVWEHYTSWLISAAPRRSQ